MFNTANWQ